MKKKREIVEYSLYEETLSETENQLFSREDYVDKEVYPTLFTNPFLYNNENAMNTMVDSIEDFAVQYKKENVYFGSVIRNSKIPKRKRIKALKKYFKKWYSDFNYTYLEAAGGSSKAIETLKATPVKMTGFKYKLIMFLFIIFYSVIVFGIVNSKYSIVNEEPIMNICNILLNMFNDNVFFKILIIIPIVIIFLLLIFGIVYRIKTREFIKTKKESKKISNRSVKELKKSFKKNYPKTYGYYLKQVKKSNDFIYEAVSINDVTCNKNDIFVIEKLISKTVSKCAVQQQRTKKYHIFACIMLLLFILSVLISICFLVYALIM